jgi:hypothetical protein
MGRNMARMSKITADRERVTYWAARLREVDNPEESPPADWIARDVALIESGIYGLWAMAGNTTVKRFVVATINDILASEGDPDHWRNNERRS